MCYQINNSAFTIFQFVLILSFVDFLLGKSPDIHVNIERINIEDVPVLDKELRDWLYKQFQKKERYHFISTFMKKVVQHA